MKERGILFSGPMVRALLDGRKTQTRRIVPAGLHVEAVEGPRAAWSEKRSTFRGQPTVSYKQVCPYGEAGDHLWVREAWRTAIELDKLTAAAIAKRALGANYQKPWAPIRYEADEQSRDWDTSVWGLRAGRYRHARFMPRWASRLTLEVTEVRVQRLHAITDEDARWEGVGLRLVDEAPERLKLPLDKAIKKSRRAGFAVLWDEVNGAGAWALNPWVWCVSFEVVRHAG